MRTDANIPHWALKKGVPFSSSPTFSLSHSILFLSLSLSFSAQVSFFTGTFVTAKPQQTRAAGTIVENSTFFSFPFSVWLVLSKINFVSYFGFNYIELHTFSISSGMLRSSKIIFYLNEFLLIQIYVLKYITIIHFFSVFNVTVFLTIKLHMKFWQK